MYDYIRHFGLEWYQKDLKHYYGTKIDKTDNKKIDKKLDRLTRKKNCIDESRVWNMKNIWQKNNSARDNSRLRGIFVQRTIFKSANWNTYLKL